MKTMHISKLIQYRNTIYYLEILFHRFFFNVFLLLLVV